MTTQADELRELIREANGVRGDLARQVKEARRMGSDIAEATQREIEASLRAFYRDGQREIMRALQEALGTVSREVMQLWDVLAGREPMPTDMRRQALRAVKDLPPYLKHDPIYYSDLHTIIGRWNELTAEQQSVVSALFASMPYQMVADKRVPLERREPILITDEQIKILPEDIHQAMRSFRNDSAKRAEGYVRGTGGGK